MISNFSEVEKSLKRCLKEKVSITAATVVGFLIAGTVAFGAVTDVTVKGDADGTIKITGVKETTISDSAGKLTVGDILKEDTTDPIDSLAGLLTVEVNGTAAIIKGNYDNQKETYLGTLSINSGNEQGVTFLTTNEDYTSITSDLKVEVTGQDGKSATAMEAAEEGHTVTNAGTIAVKDYALGMVAGAGATAVNDTNSEITVKGENSSVGMSATTVTGSTTTLTNNGKITVTKGTGISVAGDGEAEVAAGEIVVAGEVNNIGINIADGTEKATVTGAKITLKGDGKGTGINAGGNVTLKDIAITLSDGATGTGIVYAGGDTEAEAEISTRDIDIKAAGKGIEATMSKAAKSTLNITTGIISTGAGATGITITGAEVADSGTSIATVKTTLGATDGTGVKVAGEKNNTINITLQDTQTPTSKTPISIAKGIDVTSNGDKGIINIDVNQSNLQVVNDGNLVNIGDVGGTTNVDINQNVELVGTGNLVNVGAITGTTNVNINKDIKVATEGTGNIVKAGAITSGTLNINLNVGDKNTTSKSLNVTEGNTALNLANVGDGTTFVKNTGNVTIGKKGILVAGGSTDGAVSLTNQGLIDLKVVDKDNEGKGNSVISSGTGVNVANYGTIKLEISSTDFLAASESEKKDLSELTTEEIKNALKTLGVSDAGTFSNLGYIELTDGKYAAGIELKGGEIYNIDSLKSVLDQPATEVRAFKIKEGDEVTFASEKADDKLSNVNLNIDGKLKIGTDSTVAIANAKDAHILNIGKEGQLTVADNATLNYSGNISADNVVNNNNAAIENNGTLTLANGALNMVAPESKTALLSEPANRVGIELTGAGTTELDNYTVNADIKGTLDGGNALQGTLSAKGKSRITGNVTDINEIKVTDNGMLTFGANSKIIVSGAAKAAGKTTEIDLANGNMGVEIGEKGKNVLKETDSAYITFKGLNVSTPQDAKSGKIVLLTNALTENTEFNLGNHELKQGAVVANGDIYYNITQGNGGIWNATFNKDGLIDKTGYKYMELNDMYVATQSIHDLLSADIDLRVAQLDDLYSNNIYSETVKMSLDTLKMNEDAVLSLNVRPKQGEYTAQGKFLFTNTDYDRDGVVRDYKVETKNTGLLGAMEYGLTDTSSVGFAFSGTKQDLDMKNGASADGDAFYFGLYRNDKFNNIDLTTGLGYMIDRVDAKNFTGKDKFDSTAFSGYVQGKYNYAIGENLTLSPKARLTVTRFQQDSINNGRMKQEEVKDTMADVELGVEIKKGIALETGRMNLLAGASFTTNVAGKDDDYYKVSFISRAGNEGDSTKVKGANLEKNSLKLNIGADVELTNGVFYNGGLSYEFDDEDRDSIGVTLGAGYKF